MLSLGVGALQLMLDRGAEVDWFSAMEIWIELGLALAGFWMFIVHTATGTNTFLDAQIFKDANFAIGLVFIFVVGILLLASMALLPPMLAQLFNHSTTLTGIVMAPADSARCFRCCWSGGSCASSMPGRSWSQGFCSRPGLST